MRLLVWRRLILTTVVGMLGALTESAAAQDSAARTPDSVRWRLLRCGTYGTVLQHRQLTREVRQALGNVWACPEGPQLIAGLWADVSGSDSGYVRTLASVSSIADRRIADAMLRAMSDRNRAPTVRLQAMGGFLAQLTSDYSGDFSFGIAREARFDSAGLTIVGWDTVRVVHLVHVLSHQSPPVPIDAAFRAQFLGAIERIAKDNSDVTEMRLAAREIAAVLCSCDMRFRSP